MSLLIKYIVSKNGAIAALSIFLVLVLADAYRQRQEVNKIRAVYNNPQVKEVEKIVRVQGPVRIVTKIIERPSGERETTIEELRAAVEEMNMASREVEPIPVARIMTPVRTDRYLLTAGVNKLSQDLDGKAFLVGYGFKNRLDLTAGVIRTDRSSGWVMATLRF